MKILTFSDFHPGVHLEDWARHVAARAAREAMMVVPEAVPPIAHHADVPPALARIDFGRWIVDCPNGDRGAYKVDPEHPVMFCHYCGNADIGGRWRPVQLPRERAAIEAELERRLLRRLQAWRPGESVRDLQIETLTLAPNLVRPEDGHVVH